MKSLVGALEEFLDLRTTKISMAKVLNKRENQLHKIENIKEINSDNMVYI